MSDERPWRLWLDDERRARVHRALEQLGAALLALSPEQIPRPPGLTAGMPGVALAHAYLSQTDLGEGHEERCHELLERSVEAAGELAGDGSLAAGVTGFAFVLEHLGANEDDDGCAELDAVIAADVAEHDELPSELMWGLTGRLLYARERLPRPSGQALHDAILERLLSRARPQGDDGVAWFNPPDDRFVGPPIMEAYPDGCYNLGVAHGNAGILALVAAADGARARKAALDGMRWLWAQRFVDGPAAFANIAGGPPYETHGWCYGDEGMGAVLFAAARALGDETWQARWLEILRRCVGRAPMKERGLTLCHGSAGTMHTWHRVYQATGEEPFADATRAWLDTLLDGLEREEAPWPGLLNGTAGIVLALTAFVAEAEPGWDRLFALSLRR